MAVPWSAFHVVVVVVVVSAEATLAPASRTVPATIEKSERLIIQLLTLHGGDAATPGENEPASGLVAQRACRLRSTRRADDWANGCCEDEAVSPASRTLRDPRIVDPNRSALPT